MSKPREIRRPQVEPQQKRYSPPGCSACEGSRPKDRNYTEVYGTKRTSLGIIRYLRCRFCGATTNKLEKPDPALENES
jgi:hypothetical protein